MHPAELDRSSEKVNVAIDETVQTELSTGVDELRSDAAHSLDFGIVAHSDDLRPANGHCLRPRLFWIFRVNAAVKHDDVRRSHDEALRLQHRNSAHQ